jgi:regulator of replication initiation timing
MQRKELALVLISIIALSAAAWSVHNQITYLRNQIGELRAQNSELQDQNRTLQDQLRELQLQDREQQDRLKDFTSELAYARGLLVNIAEFSWSRGGSPIVGVTLIHRVNVTVQNNDVIPMSGLVLTFRLQQKDLGTKIGDEGTTRIERLNAGESLETWGGVYTTIGTSLDDAVCVVTLKAGDIVLDELTQGPS